MRNGNIKVLVVEDSASIRQLLVHILQEEPGIEVVGTAGNGVEALEALARTSPDLVTVDVNMPRMNGFELTRRIMETQPVPVIIVSASWQPDEVATTFSAVEAGAVAIIGKPRGPGHRDHKEEAQKLIDTVKAMAEVKVVRRWARSRMLDPKAPAAAGAVPPRALDAIPAIRLVAIGASTGGPLVLQTILARLPRKFGVPVLIVQHIAAGFLDGMAEWLGSTTGFPVQVAGAGELALPGRAYLAPDGLHTGVASDGRIVLSLEAPDEGLRPSVAHLFASVARVYGANAAGVLLTGMGRDGAKGLKLMRQQGAVTIAQDQESSVVFGMPGEAVKLDAAAYVLGPERIAALLEAVVDRK